MIRWSAETNLWLLTEAEFSQIPNGTELVCFTGERKIKGRDHIDDDTRFGYLAWGIESPETHELAPLLMKFKLETP